MKARHSHPVLRQQRKPPPKGPNPVNPPAPHEPIPPRLWSTWWEQHPQTPAPAVSAPAAPSTTRVSLAAPIPPAPLAEVNAQVTAVVVNYKTAPLIQQAFESLRAAYPDLPVVLIDNGSRDLSTKYLKGLTGQAGVTVVLNPANRGHGPALDQAFREVVTTPFVLTLDSDTQIVKGGFLELMLGWLHTTGAYGVGWLRTTDEQTGVATDDWQIGQPGFMPYLHPATALWDRAKYLTLEPFINGGAPAVSNMRAARAAGHTVLSFPVQNYVKHLVAGTRRMYGGDWKGEGEPGAWREGDKHPI